MADPVRMIDPDVTAFWWHIQECAYCQTHSDPCPQGRELCAPIVQRMADKIDADALAYAEKAIRACDVEKKP